MKEKSEERIKAAAMLDGFRVIGQRRSLRRLGLLGENEPGAEPGNYVTSVWLVFDYQPEEPTLMVEKADQLIPVMELATKRYSDVSVTLEMTLTAARLVFEAREDYLTVNKVMEHAPDLRLYQIQVDTKYVAFLGPKDMDEDRLHDLFLNVEDDWAQYLNSRCFPLTVDRTEQEALISMAKKVANVDIVDLVKYVVVIRTYGQFIYDNFNFPFNPNLNEAYTKAITPAG